jgi:hypothetical protein
MHAKNVILLANYKQLVAQLLDLQLVEIVHISAK